MYIADLRAPAASQQEQQDYLEDRVVASNIGMNARSLCSGEMEAYAEMFSAMLEWILEASERMLKTGDAEDAHEEHPNAYTVLVEQASSGDWDAVTRLIKDIGLSPIKEIGLSPTAIARGAGGSALEAASRAGHAALVNYLLYSAANATLLGPHENLVFGSGSMRQLQAAGAGVGRAQEIYTVRALEMLRSHKMYTQRFVILWFVFFVNPEFQEHLAAAGGSGGGLERVGDLSYEGAAGTEEFQTRYGLLLMCSALDPALESLDGSRFLPLCLWNHAMDSILDLHS